MFFQVTEALPSVRNTSSGSDVGGARRKSLERYRSSYITNKFLCQHPAQLIGGMHRLTKKFLYIGSAPHKYAKIDLSTGGKTKEMSMQLYTTLGAQFNRDQFVFTKVIADLAYMDSIHDTNTYKREGRVEYMHFNPHFSLKYKSHIFALMMYMKYVCFKFPLVYHLGLTVDDK